MGPQIPVGLVLAPLSARALDHADHRLRRCLAGGRDHAGLIWLLDGHKIVALTADTAVIETAAGARQTYRRLAIEADQVVLAWELE